LVFPVAVARRLRPLGAVKFLRQRRGAGGRLTARLGFGQRTLGRRRQRLSFLTWSGFVVHCQPPVFGTTRSIDCPNGLKMPVGMLTFGIFAWQMWGPLGMPRLLAELPLSFG